MPFPSFDRPAQRLVLLASAAMLFASSAMAADRSELERDARNALQKLNATVPAANALSTDAVTVLVFPKITKAGLGVGGQFNSGVLFKQGKVEGFYDTRGASYGLQAGVQQFGYALFLMNDKTLGALNQNEGLEIGVGPSFVVVDQGMGKTMTTTTAKDDIYAFTLGQKGLIGGVGLVGNKVTRLKD